MTTHVELATTDHVARVRFTSERGVQLFSTAVRDRLDAILGELESRRSSRVIVFEAEGRTFIAGADIHELRTLDAQTARQFAEQGQALMDRIARLPAVTIAAIHAACAGGGCELALACDLRMAAACARIGLPEVSLGVIPGWGGTVRAVRLLGGGAARRLILTGELLVAEDALRLGLVDSVTPEDGFRAAVDERVQILLSRGPAACREARRLIGAFEGADVAGELQAEAAAFAACFAAGQAQEGLEAFLRKRPAHWESPRVQSTA